MPRRVRHQDLSLDYCCSITIYTRTRLVLWRFQWITQFRLFTLICRRLETRINHSIITYYWIIWDEAGVLTVLAALQCCHFITTISGPSVALHILAQTVLAALQGCHSVITTLASLWLSSFWWLSIPRSGHPLGCSRGRLVRRLSR